MLNKILKGKDEQAQIRLEKLSNSLADNPNILWYPSAGKDFHDVLELIPERFETHQLEELPDLFIHTDYRPDGINDDWLHVDEVLYSDSRTKVRVVTKYELQLEPRLRYFPDHSYIHSQAYDKPIIYLLDICIESNQYSISNKTVLYFLFENINFLDEIILKNKILISHIVKISDGSSFGGGNQSMSLIYAFLSEMKTKYLLADTFGYPDFNVIEMLKQKNRISPSSYDLFRTNGKLNGFNIFKISHKPTELTDEVFNRIMEDIRGEE